MIDAATLVLLATRFRDAIERTAFGAHEGNWSWFPADCCHHATKLLGLFLFENGQGIFNVVFGRKDSREHAWLQQGTAVLDITADQFGGEGFGRVVVLSDSDWHVSWEVVPNPEVYSELYYRRLKSDEQYGRWYQLILNNSSEAACE